MGETYFIDCVPCGKRLEDGNASSTEAAFSRWARAQGWTISPTRCPVHARRAGEERIAAALAAREACHLPHDPNAWVRGGGIATAGVAFGTSTRWRCEPSPEFCQVRNHYLVEPEGFVAPVRRFSPAQMTALSAMANAGYHDDQSWIRANTLRSLRGLWFEQRETLFLNSAGKAAFEAAGGDEALEALGSWWSSS